MRCNEGYFYLVKIKFTLDIFPIFRFFELTLDIFGFWNSKFTLDIIRFLSSERNLAYPNVSSNLILHSDIKFPGTFGIMTKENIVLGICLNMFFFVLLCSFWCSFVLFVKNHKKPCSLFFLSKITKNHVLYSFFQNWVEEQSS